MDNIIVVEILMKENQQYVPWIVDTTQNARHDRWLKKKKIKNTKGTGK